MKIALSLLVGAALATQFHQARQATGRFASDDRNPFAYVPTRNDMENLEPWLKQLQQVAPGGALEPIGVVGADYWPLPWYLRSFKKIGYWPAPSADFTQLPLVFAMPEVAEVVTSQLQQTHTSLPRPLRAGVPVVLFLRNDIWNSWKNEGK